MAEEIIEFEGRKFLKIGKGKPQCGQLYITPISRRVRAAKIDFSIELELLRELPAVVQPHECVESKQSGCCLICDKPLAQLREQAAGQPGEAVCELANKLLDTMLPHAFRTSGDDIIKSTLKDMGAVISAELAPLLEKARKHFEYALHLQNHEGLVALEFSRKKQQSFEDLADELARWT